MIGYSSLMMIAKTALPITDGIGDMETSPHDSERGDARKSYRANQRNTPLIAGLLVLAG